MNWMVSEHYRALRAKIEDKSARVGIIGLGYVGLPLARAFAAAGFPVAGFDVDAAKVAALARGDSQIRDESGRAAPMGTICTGPANRSGGAVSDGGRNSAIVACPSALMPRRRARATTVRPAIRRSSGSDLFSTYQTSRANRSSQPTSLRPFTWAQPVSPGRTVWRSYSAGVYRRT